MQHATPTSEAKTEAMQSKSQTQPPPVGALYPQADISCHGITGRECEYWLYPPIGYQPLAEFDGVRGRDVIECKCGYDHFLDHPDSPASRGALDKMIKEILSHLRYAQDCGLQYCVYVSSQRLADWIREEPGLGTQVNVIVRPAEECD